MNVSIVIPLWQGADTILDCLNALTANTEGVPHEIICVDNASPDESGAIVQQNYEEVTVLRQPVNLGFAGGVNVGLRAAKGDVLVLLNQDCLVRPGWLEPLTETFERFPACGIAGCTILNADGTVNHAGARLERPGAYGIHLTEIADGPVEADYVTGAVFAIRRTTWAAIGALDEDFYPAYYEESDYCYRARRRGFEVRYVPDSQAEHLFSARDWQADPIKHAANQHQSRYRFIGKHFDSDELAAFFAAEDEAISAEIYREQMIGRVEAIRHTLLHLTSILDRRSHDFGESTSTIRAHQLRVGFGQLWRAANERALQSSSGDDTASPSAHVLLQSHRHRMYQLLDELRGSREEAERLRVLQHELLDSIYFRSPISSTEYESTMSRLFRLLIKRPASILCGRDYMLRSKLNVLQAMQLEQTEHVDRCMNELLELTLSQVTRTTEEQELMRLLAKYEYR